MKRLVRALLLCLLATSAALATPDPAPPKPEDEAIREAQARRRRVTALMTEAYDHMEAGLRLLSKASSEDSAAPSASEQEALRKQAHERYGKAVAAYEEALKLVPALVSVPKERLLAVKQVIHYNLACAHARRGEADPALSALGKTLELGYADLERLEKDPDLASIRGNERFVNLLERVQAKLAKQAMEAAAAELGEEALFPYDFQVTTLEGKALSLKDLRGKVVIVDYWGTWCPPCRMEIPHFVELAKKYEKDLVIVGMTWERGQSGDAVVANVKAFAKKLGASYPMALLTKQEDLTRIQLEAFPTTLFIDRQGRVRAREVGYRDLASLEKIVKALAKEPAPAKEPEKKEPGKEPEKKKEPRPF